MKIQVQVGERYAKGGTVGVVKSITSGKAPRVQVLTVNTGEREFVDAVEFAATWREAA